MKKLDTVESFRIEPLGTKVSLHFLFEDLTPTNMVWLSIFQDRSQKKKVTTWDNADYLLELYHAFKKQEYPEEFEEFCEEHGFSKKETRQEIYTVIHKAKKLKLL